MSLTTVITPPSIFQTSIQPQSGSSVTVMNPMQPQTVTTIGIGFMGPPGKAGVSGGAALFVQNAAPTADGAYLWVQTGLGGGSDMTFWVEDGL